MIRCYIPPDQWGEGDFVLSGREAHHLARVLRVRSGEKILCFDGTGREADAIVQKIAGDRLHLQVGPARRLPPDPFSLALAFSIPGQGKADEIVAQATQMGIAKILPMVTARSVVRGRQERLLRKQDRFLQIAVESAKQCGIPRIPQIEPVQPWDRLPGSFPLYDTVLLASLEGPWNPLPDLLKAPSIRTVLVLIGPEGDFTPEETEGAVRAGARRFSLGPTVLRCETACVSSLSVISFLLRSRNLFWHP